MNFSNTLLFFYLLKLTKEWFTFILFYLSSTLTLSSSNSEPFVSTFLLMKLIWNPALSFVIFVRVSLQRECASSYTNVALCRLFVFCPKDFL